MWVEFGGVGRAMSVEAQREALTAVGGVDSNELLARPLCLMPAQDADDSGMRLRNAIRKGGCRGHQDATGFRR